MAATLFLAKYTHTLSLSFFFFHFFLSLFLSFFLAIVKTGKPKPLTYKTRNIRIVSIT